MNTPAQPRSTEASASDPRHVVLVGCEDEENLGLRYIAAYLESNRVSTAIEPFDPTDHEGLVRRIRSSSPLVVGFSIIFQRMLPDFARAVDRLRDDGVESHLTCGGHFPTLEPEETLASIPGLDSVVRHEGEMTMLELVRNLQNGGKLEDIDGIAYRRSDGVRINTPRALIEDLDLLPFPLRDKPRLAVNGHGVSSIIASRGCVFDCSFCSVQNFYREAPGPARRSRSPANVVDEMQWMADELGVRVFIFKDDDISTRGPKHGAWIEAFAAELEQRCLANRVLFRISCRVDEVVGDRLKRLQDVGLTAVYLGIESGNENGLRHFNKRYGLADIIRAADTLDELGLAYEYGFMMFEPWSTLATIYGDLALLEDLGTRGSSVVDFTKTMPYAGTAIARRLEDEGRLEGTVAAPDYGYLDKRVMHLQRFASNTFHERNFEANGLVNRLRMAKFEAAIAGSLGGYDPTAANTSDHVADLIRRNNADAIEAMRLATRLLDDCESDLEPRHWQVLQLFASQYKTAEAPIKAELERLETLHTAH